MDYLDQPFGAPRYGYAVQDTDFPQVQFGDDPMGPVGMQPVGAGSVRSRVSFPSLAENDASYRADMSVRQNADALAKRVSSASPEEAGIIADDMSNLKSGYRALKGEGWDPAKAASAANGMYAAFGTYSDFSSKAKVLSDIADRRGVGIGEVAKRISRLRTAFKGQYLHDCGYKDGARADLFNMADADDEFSAAFSAIRDIEDKYNVDFDDSVYGDVLGRVARTSAALSGYGSSSSEIGIDKVVESAMYEVGALSGGDPSKNPVSDFVAMNAQDRAGITWSAYDVSPEDPRSDASPSKSDGLDYGRPNTAKGQEDDQDFSMSRGIRSAFARHRVRNMSNGLSVDDYSDTSMLREDLVSEMKVNSMTTKGLDDGDFGLLADAIIAKRSRGERVSVVDTLRDMLYAPDPQALSDRDRRYYARTVNGSWGSSMSQVIGLFQSGNMQPGRIQQAKDLMFDQLRMSGMSERAQDVVRKMFNAHLDEYNLEAKKLVDEASDDPGKTKPQRFQHRAAQLAQAVQLVSMIDVCRQGKVIDDDTARELTESMFDKENPGRLNLGVFHTVNAGFGHASRRDTMSNWLLQTDRPFKDIGWFAKTKVREKNSDPLEQIFRTLDTALKNSNSDGLGDLRRICSKTVEVMDAYRKTYEDITKDSDGYLQLNSNKETAELREEDDLSAGWWFGETLSKHIPEWLGGGSDRYNFRENMKRVNNLMEQIRNEGYVIPGMEKEGYTRTFSNLDLAARWDSVAKSTIRASETLSPSNGTLLYGISPEKAEAWASWSRNQTMDTPSGKQVVDNLSRGIFESFMRDFPGISQDDPRAKAALADLKRMIRNSYVSAKSIGGLDDLNDMESYMLETAAQAGSHPNDYRNGWDGFTGDFRLAQELSEVFSPLQMASQRKYDMLRQAEAEQQVLARRKAEQMKSAEAQAAEAEEQAASEREALEKADKIASGEQ